jgi:hypothetical protein
MPLLVSGDLRMQQAAFLVRNDRHVLRLFLSDAGCFNPGAAAYIQANEKLMPDDVVNFEQLACPERA